MLLPLPFIPTTIKSAFSLFETSNISGVAAPSLAALLSWLYIFCEEFIHISILICLADKVTCEKSGEIWSGPHLLMICVTLETNYGYDTFLVRLYEPPASVDLEDTNELNYHSMYKFHRKSIADLVFWNEKLIKITCRHRSRLCRIKRLT